jgi:hypothetical protein
VCPLHMSSYSTALPGVAWPQLLLTELFVLSRVLVTNNAGSASDGWIY